jgi:hypothetical protein
MEKIYSKPVQKGSHLQSRAEGSFAFVENLPKVCIDPRDRGVAASVATCNGSTAAVALEHSRVEEKKQNSVLNFKTLGNDKLQGLR